MSGPRIRVLVVDDSAFARKVVREVLVRDSRIEILGHARDGLDALEKIQELAPDVITLDLVMPELDGLGVLEALKVLSTRPQVVLVTMTDAESDLGVRALQAGVFEVVHKPTALATDRLYELGDELLGKVLAAGDRAHRETHKNVSTPSQPPRATPSRPPPAPTTRRAPSGSTRPPQLIVIGASTGGPRAVGAVLSALPATFRIPLAVVLHLPVGYTEAYARRLSADSVFEVVEARDGVEFCAGRVVVAKAGHHMRVVRQGSTSAAALSFEPTAHLHRPAVDELFSSAAAAWGGDILGLVLTGMGSDGLEGARAIRAAGGRVFVEHECSCVVYGMPRVIVEAGLADRIIPLADIAAALDACG